MSAIVERVLLIGWDPAGWKTSSPLIEQGHMPRGERAIGASAPGSVASPTLMLSPVLWTAIAAGRHAGQHGIRGPSSQTLAARRSAR